MFSVIVNIPFFIKCVALKWAFPMYNALILPHMVRIYVAAKMLCKTNTGFHQTLQSKYSRKEVKTQWDETKSVQKNLEEMGLAYDPNKAIDNHAKSEESMDLDKPAKSFVAESLEADANAPRVKLFRLPKGQCEWLANMIKKYGEDFKAMSRDKNNLDQLTWKQLRAKIKTFKGIPEQYEEYMGSSS